MNVHTYERAFLTLGGVLLVLCMAALVYATVAMGIHLPGRAGEIDPLQVFSTPPFDNPGVHQTGPDRYDVVIIGQAWRFHPEEIRVPAGAELNFIGTTFDVIHGFAIEGTRVNVMLIPGQISRQTYRFREPGEYLIVCHEYCGAGHHNMYGKIIVE
ncbi:MAG: cytochrome c oxidase subunit II [Rhodothermaceae bacterium]|nr:MAG: cytochrome c oxidase subunit II [Rhodothermaceae bacterium]